MTEADFIAVLDAYGADPARWPVRDRQAALDWRAAHPAQADALMADAGALDALLDAAPAPTVNSALRASILASAVAATVVKGERSGDASGAGRRFAALFGRLPQASAAIACALALGLGLGFFTGAGVDVDAGLLDAYDMAYADLETYLSTEGS